MPTSDGFRVACQCTVCPGAITLGSVTGSPTGMSTARLPSVYKVRSSRFPSGLADDRNWMDSPSAGADVPLCTIPVTVTLWPGCAHCGLSDSMYTEGRGGAY